MLHCQWHTEITLEFLNINFSSTSQSRFEPQESRQAYPLSIALIYQYGSCALKGQCNLIQPISQINQSNIWNRIWFEHSSVSDSVWYYLCYTIKKRCSQSYKLNSLSVRFEWSFQSASSIMNFLRNSHSVGNQSINQCIFLDHGFVSWLYSRCWAMS